MCMSFVSLSGGYHVVCFAMLCHHQTDVCTQERNYRARKKTHIFKFALTVHLNVLTCCVIMC